jgi:hypothetical protein
LFSFFKEEEEEEEDEETNPLKCRPIEIQVVLRLTYRFSP